MDWLDDDYNIKTDIAESDIYSLPSEVSLTLEIDYNLSLY